MNKIKELLSEKNPNCDKKISENEITSSNKIKNSTVSISNQLPHTQEEIYDEEEQARLFREAVENFRRGGDLDNQMVQINKNKNKDIKSVIQSELGTSPENFDPNSSMLPANKERSCCWNCLKIILSEGSIKHIFEEKIMKLKVVMKKKILIIIFIQFIF
jgi:uncharacterized protein YllA (UPF0747 family)